MTAFTSELIGTAFLIILGDGVVANVLLNKTNGFSSGWIVITMGWAMAVFTGVFISASAGHRQVHLNPAITIAAAYLGKFDWALVPTYIAAQMLGAMIGAFVVWLAYKQHFDATENISNKLAVFCTGPAIRNPVHNFITEAIGTFQRVSKPVSTVLKC
jgi:glycerol uptake facilitator protein